MNFYKALLLINPLKIKSLTAFAIISVDLHSVLSQRKIEAEKKQRTAAERKRKKG